MRPATRGVCMRARAPTLYKDLCDRTEIDLYAVEGSAVVAARARGRLGK